jgi:hypothetical protein
MISTARADRRQKLDISKTSWRRGNRFFAAIGIRLTSHNLGPGRDALSKAHIAAVALADAERGRAHGRPGDALAGCCRALFPLAALICGSDM